MEEFMCKNADNVELDGSIYSAVSLHNTYRIGSIKAYICVLRLKIRASTLYKFITLELSPCQWRWKQSKREIIYTYTSYIICVYKTNTLIYLSYKLHRMPRATRCFITHSLHTWILDTANVDKFNGSLPKAKGKFNSLFLVFVAARFYCCHCVDVG